jgi:hypothetical protein
VILASLQRDPERPALRKERKLVQTLENAAASLHLNRRLEVVLLMTAVVMMGAASVFWE